ncbi:MAG: septum formation protein Maf [Mogibacterium sp.]|nr:septum formation protein Maf [Mogibacterium sp.]
MNNSRIILASASPRRLEILNAHGIEPVVLPQDTDEHLPDGIGMTEAVEELASQKAKACYDYVKDNPLYDGYLIVGADTIVWKDEIMGKPADAYDAFRMLDKIRGTFHYVVTGICLIDKSSGSVNVLNDVTTVHCVDYSDEDINAYISQAEPYDKAGSYAIQGYFGRYIDHIDGDYENVVGLPFYRIEAALKPYI